MEIERSLTFKDGESQELRVSLRGDGSTTFAFPLDSGLFENAFLAVLNGSDTEALILFLRGSEQ